MPFKRHLPAGIGPRPAQRLLFRGLVLLGALGVLAAAPAGAEPGGPPEGPAPPLRLGTSGDYRPFSWRARDAEARLPGAEGDAEPGRAEGDAAEADAADGTGGLRGFSLSVARAFAADTGRRLEIVPFAWPDLLDDLAAGRFDAAASGITVRPERSAAGRFSVPVAESGAVVLLPADHPARGLDDLDAPGVRIAVNRGGHLERVARARFPRARVEALAPNDAVPEALRAGRADAVVTDSVEAPHWRRGTGWRLLGPFTRDRKAWLLPADADALAARLDAWLLAREADGSLARWRAEHRVPRGATATPEAALQAALDERLALMPAVAEAKRAAGLPVEAPAREEVVVEAGLEAVRRAAAEAGVPPPPDETVRAFYRAQIEAAKQVQRATLAAPPDPSVPKLDLDRDLRPALLRLGDKIARLLLSVNQRGQSPT